MLYLICLTKDVFMLNICLSPKLTKWQRCDILINLTIGTAQVLLIIPYIIYAQPVVNTSIHSYLLTVIFAIELLMTAACSSYIVLPTGK